jgi:hypothetical protein
MNGKKNSNTNITWYDKNSARLKKKNLLYAKLHKKIYKCKHPACNGLVFSTGRLAIIHQKVLGHGIEDINSNNKNIRKRRGGVVELTPKVSLVTF